ncbi:MAG: hypothetical protein L6R38_003631 [Xanthoria sp. 2 TBL-2021]|nr:MAG: hypothetical protein L6R38_003631 [Xanthoria sp. 2 TBL-2021]
MSMSYRVSLNGPDNVGKTTQIDLLPSSFTIGKVGGLHKTDNTKIGELHRQGLLRQWWWESSNEEFIRFIVGALARRHLDSMTDTLNQVILFDRGAAMFEAVVVAVIATKSLDHNLDNARAAFQAILNENHLQLPRERLAILLTHGGSLDGSLKITLNREEGILDERYKLYQFLLQTEMQRQERSGVYQHVIKIHTTSSIGIVQDELRKVLLRYTGNRLFTPMLHRLDNIYVISGLSESGKSSVAEGFCSHYGTGQAFRAKIVYFNNLISERLGKGIYSVPEKEQAQYLLHELERFSNDHYWLKIITIESMHRYMVATWLKKWLGKMIQIIYIDTADVRRLERALLAPEVIAENDRLKKERGVELIRSDADLVLDNNGTFADTVNALLRFAESNRRRN